MEGVKLFLSAKNLREGKKKTCVVERDSFERFPSPPHLCSLSHKQQIDGRGIGYWYRLHERNS